MKNIRTGPNQKYYKCNKGTTPTHWNKQIATIEARLVSIHQTLTTEVLAQLNATPALLNLAFQMLG